MVEPNQEISCNVIDVNTSPYTDQNPGTSGLRKKVKVFQQENYLHNFVQSVFNAHTPEEYQGKTLILGGDGRFYNDQAIDIIVKISFANGIRTILVPKSGVLSTPCVSVLIIKTPNCFGGLILSASHNPGGEHEDFGIKFNSHNGAPSSETITNLVFQSSVSIKTYKYLDYKGPSLFGTETTFTINENKGYALKFIDTTTDYIEMMKEQFDFELIDGLFKKKGFSFLFDAMHGASGPYALEIFGKIFGLDEKNLLNCNVLPDFGGHHPDPNLVYAKRLVHELNIFKTKTEGERYQFGAACDGDADRNMILGWETFASPSDSLAVIASNHFRIKCFKSGLKGVARSMPTSSAVDRVCSKLQLPFYEVPTGWKFFGNLMDAGKINLCGEESFGTSSSHIREKDGIWAVLCWLSILADLNKDKEEFTVTVNDVLQNHWKEYGRDYYCRHDYEDLSLKQAADVVAEIEKSMKQFEGIGKSYIFEYLDSIDHSLSKNQGWIFDFNGKSRIIYRKSGTSSSGVTIRIYFEKYNETEFNLKLDEAIQDLVDSSLKFSQIHEITGKSRPSVIT